MLPKPAKGTPFVNQMIDKGTRKEDDRRDKAKPVIVISRKGFRE